MKLSTARTQMRQPKYRRLVKTLGARAWIIGFAFMLSACGFHLRGQSESIAYQFPELQLKCKSKKHWELCHYLSNRLRASGVALQDKAPITLKINVPDSKQRTFSLNMDATSAETELMQSAHYQLIDRKNGEVIAQHSVERSQIYRLNASALIAKDREKAELQKSLDIAIADAILRELSLLTPR